MEVKEIIILARVIYPDKPLVEATQKMIALGVLPPEAIGEIEAAIKNGLVDWWGNGIPHQISGAARLRPPLDVKLSKSTWYTQNI